MVDNDDVGCLDERGGLTFFAGKPAPTRPRIHDAKRVALDLDLRRPVKHAGQSRSEGTPSLGEVASVGAKAFCLLLGLSKSEPP